ncbi:hypothetical protein FRC10_011335, partial [Ceratobasidium sp. 414]
MPPAVPPETTLRLSNFSIHQPPPLELVRRAIPVLEKRVNPWRKSGVGHAKSNLSPLALQDLSSVLELYRTYLAKDITWEQASNNVAQAKGLGTGHSRTLRTWARACLLDPEFIPRTSYGQNCSSMIEHDEFRKELEIYLREVGKYASAKPCFPT